MVDALNLFGLIAFGLVGVAVGSFLNVVADRAPLGQSLLRPPSHCPGCQRKLAMLDLIPVVSYVALRGRCRTCGERIPVRILAVELVTGMLFALLWWLFGPSLRLVLSTLYVSVLIVVFVIDLEFKLVLNVIILPVIALTLLAIPLQLLIKPPVFTYVAFPSIMASLGHLSLPQLAMVSQLVGGLIAFGIFLLIWLVAPNGMGAGDVKLAAFVGLVTGFPGALAAVFGSFVLGGVVALGLLLTGQANRKTAIPFAPFLVITTLIMVLYGDPIIAWYLAQ